MDLNKINKIIIEGEVTGMSRAGCDYSFYISVYEYKSGKNNTVKIVKTIKDKYIEDEKVLNLLNNPSMNYFRRALEMNPTLKDITKYTMFYLLGSWITLITILVSKIIENNK